MNAKIIALFVLAVLLITGCSGFADTKASAEPQPVTCEVPFIPKGDSCCLDTNDNGYCDHDEAALNASGKLPQT